MANQRQGSEDHLSARRRLIKGSFAAPAALTLFSGGAAAGSAGVCVARAADSTSAPAEQVAIADGWLRVQAGKSTKNAQAKFDSYWVSYTDIFLVASRAGIKSGWTSNVSLCVDAGDGTTNGSGFNKGMLYSSTTSPAVPTSISYAAPLRYYLVLVDTSGQIIGTGPNHTNGGNSVSQSCWTSFAR